MLDNADDVEFVVDRAPSVVESWSSRRLPYEPRGRALSFRRALQDALAQLPPAHLHVWYVSPDDSPCVLANILFFNVGSPALTDLLGAGVCIERGFSELDPGDDRPSRHYVRYEVAGAPGLRLWRGRDVLARWDAVLPPAGRYLPDDWWWSVAAGLVGPTRPADAWFMLRFRVPSQFPVRWALRPLLDGTISALHSSPATDPEALRRLSDRLGEPREAVQELLAGVGRPLPSREVVRRYRRGIRWHPAHDRLAAVSVTIDPKLSADRFAGELVAVRPVPPRCG